MVDTFTESSIQNIQKHTTRYLKRWLNLPRSSTLATLFHPEVLNFPFLPHVREFAKLSMLCAIDHSSDAVINELACLLSDPEFRKRQQTSIDVLQQARSSIKAISSTDVKAKSIMKMLSIGQILLTTFKSRKSLKILLYWKWIAQYGIVL